MTTHLVIPDTQVRPDVDLSFLLAIGKLIADRRPDKIICLGDFADMPSLSSYDKGKLAMEGRKLVNDFKAAREGMDLLLKPLKELQAKKKANHMKLYKPELHMICGNHDTSRIDRLIQENPIFEGYITADEFPYEDWQTHEFLTPVNIDEIIYCHYIQNPMSGKPMGGSCLNILKNVGKSFIVGHQQVLDIANRYTIDGKQQWAIKAGASYPWDENYKGVQGNMHWRGVLYLTNVLDGSFDLETMRTSALMSKYL